MSYMRRVVARDLDVPHSFSTMKRWNIYGGDYDEFLSDIDQVRSANRSGRVLRFYKDERRFPAGGLARGRFIGRNRYKINFQLRGWNKKTGEPMVRHIWHEFDRSRSSEDVTREMFERGEDEITDFYCHRVTGLYGLRH